MEGMVVGTGKDINGNRTFDIQMYDERFAVDAEEVLLRGLEPGRSVTFITDIETGKAEIVHPDKVIGCRSVER